MAAAAPARNPVDQAFEWIGFGVDADRDRIRDEGGFDAFDDFIGITDNDVRDMASGFAKRTVAQGRVNFGMRRIKYTLGVMHWVQDEARCSRTAVLDGIADADAFKGILSTSLERATLRKVNAEQVDTICKAADPGKFKDERTWPEWEVKFDNYLSTIPGVNGVPLSYVTRSNENPDRTTDFQGDFIAETVACAPLTGAHFQADTRKVHQLLKNYLVSETAEQWISDIEKRANGRQDMDALRRHYSGEGNVSRRVATADRLRETLHYKSERAMPFSTFLDRMQKMFNIFRDEGETMADSTQVRELFKRVQHPQLQDTVKALQVRADLDGITYTEAANHLTAAVSQMPEYQLARKVAGLQTGTPNGGGGGLNGRKGGRNSGTIYNSKGKIHTGYYRNWKSLSDEDRKAVIAARKQKGDKGHQSASKKEMENNKRKFAELSSLVEGGITEMKASIAAIANRSQGTTPEDEVRPETPASGDAGNAFGGRAAKRANI